MIVRFNGSFMVEAASVQEAEALLFEMVESSPYNSKVTIVLTEGQEDEGSLLPSVDYTGK